MITWKHTTWRLLSIKVFTWAVKKPVLIYNMKSVWPGHPDCWWLQELKELRERCRCRWTTLLCSMDNDPANHLYRQPCIFVPPDQGLRIWKSRHVPVSGGCISREHRPQFADFAIIRGYPAVITKIMTACVRLRALEPVVIPFPTNGKLRTVAPHLHIKKAVNGVSITSGWNHHPRCRATTGLWNCRDHDNDWDPTTNTIPHGPPSGIAFMPDEEMEWDQPILDIKTECWSSCLYTDAGG